MTRFSVFQGDLSIDESMVNYYGCYSCKQFIRTKPICFGYKLWVLSLTWFLFEIYKGDTGNSSDESSRTRVAKYALSVYQNSHSRQMFFHNFLSSYRLLINVDEK